MIKKARLSALVGLLALLFFPSSSYSLGVRGSDGSCYLIVDTSGYVIAPDSRYGVYSTVAETRLADNPMIKASGQYGGSTWGNYTRIGLISAYKWSGSGWSFAFYPGDLNGKYITDSVAAIVKSWSISAGAYPSLASLPASPPADACAVPACDIGDSDSDGICNSCDKVPGAPDPKDCVYMTSVNSQGQVVDMTINEGCKDKSDPSFNPENLAHYRNEEAAAVGDGRLYFNLTAYDREMSGKTCSSTSVADADGNCSCAYPATNTKLAGFTDSSGQPAVISPDSEKEFENAQNLDKQNKLNDCGKIKEYCEAACVLYGWPEKNTCIVADGTLRNSCVCRDNSFAFDLENESSESSENPDNSSADSDGDGVPDSIDPDSTGGLDSNADNVDDIAAAVNGAIASLGLGGKLDAVNSNLNIIGNYVSSLGSKITGVTTAVNSVGSAVSGLGSKIDGVGSSVDGLGSKIDGVGSAVSGLGSKIDGVGSSVDGLGTSLGGKLDGLGEKLDGISDKLDDGLEATGSADLPGTNEYNTDLEELEEQSFVDTVHNFLNSSLPVLSSISGSGLTASGSPSISTELWGETIRIDFSDWQGVLRAAGLVLVAVATIFAFIIIL